MIYLILAAGLAFGALFLHDEHLQGKVDELETKVSTAESRVKSLETQLSDEEEKRRIDIEVLTEHQAEQAGRINAAWKAKLAAQAGAARAQIGQLEGKLHAYITPASDSRCTVPVGALVFHDAAARGAADQGGAQVPAGAGGSVDADSRLHLSDVFAVVASNYAGAQAALAAAVAEIAAWRDWYVAQRALFTGEK